MDTTSLEMFKSRKLIVFVPLELEALQYTGTTLLSSDFVSFTQAPTKIYPLGNVGLNVKVTLEFG